MNNLRLPLTILLAALLCATQAPAQNTSPADRNAVDTAARPGGMMAEAIYGTRPIAPYKDGNVVFTRKGKSAYAIYLTSKEGEAMPQPISFAGLAPAPGSKVQLLGSRKNLSWQTDTAGRTVVVIPASLAQSPPCRHAFALKFSPVIRE